MRLQLGTSFDVTTRKRQTDFSSSLAGCSATSSFEVTISNAKTIAQDVLTILDENLPSAKSSASTATWSVYVPASGRTVLTYKARSTWC